MKHFRKWAEDKSPIVATLGLSMAVVAEGCFFLMKSFKDEKYLEGRVSVPDLDEWLSLYRNQRKVLNDVFNTFAAMSDEYEAVIEYFDMCVRFIRNCGAEERKRIITNPCSENEEDISLYIREESERVQEWMMREFHRLVSEEDGKKFIEKFYTPEIVFFMKVWVPCLIFHGDLLPRILRRARQGDYDAIEHLLEIDESIINDSRIGELYHQATVAKERGRIKGMTKALGKKPKKKIDRRTIRYYFAGFLSGYSILMDEELTAKEINSLYMAVAEDFGGDTDEVDLMVKVGTKKTSYEEEGEQEGEDFIDQDTLRKEIYNARNLWKIFRIPERK